MKYLRWVLPLLFVVITSAASTLPQQGASAISAVLKTATDRGDVPGVAVAVVNKDGLLYNEGFGKSRTLTNTPMAKDTIFNMASMTKPVTSVAIMMLVDEGKLKLDDEVSIAARAKAEQAEIYWADETAIRQDATWVRGYAPAGVTPELALPAGRHAATTMISAITNQGLVRFCFFDGALDTDRFIAFLGDLIVDAGRKVFLIVDNLKVHRATRVTEWVAEHAERIELFYLPPYAPELNPDEYLNRDLKTSIRSGPIARTAKALLEKAKHCMQRIAAMPERVRSYFNHQAVRYAQ